MSLLGSIFALQLVDTFIHGLRTGKFIVSAAGFSHQKELNFAVDWLALAMETDDIQSFKVAEEFFRKVALDDVAYYQVVAFFGRAICAAGMGNYTVARHWCELAEEKNVSLFKDKAALIKSNAKQLRQKIVSQGLLQSNEGSEYGLPQSPEERGKIEPKQAIVLKEVSDSPQIGKPGEWPDFKWE